MEFIGIPLAALVGAVAGYLLCYYHSKQVVAAATTAASATAAAMTPGATPLVTGPTPSVAVNSAISKVEIEFAKIVADVKAEAAKL